MGYFEIGVYQGKTIENIGTLWRSAYQLGASGLFVIGKRYKRQASDTYRSTRHIPLREYDTFDEFLVSRPKGAQLIGVEMGGTVLGEFAHPKQAIYLLGSEDNGLPEKVLMRCDHVISLQAVGQQSYNVAVAGSIVMYSRVYPVTSVTTPRRSARVE